VATDSKSSRTTVTPAQAEQLVGILSAAFDDVMSAGSIDVLAENEDRLRCAYGWWVWINRSAKLVELAIGQGLGHEATPNVRTILEHTVALLWVIDEGDVVVDAVEAAASVSRGKLYDKLVEAGWPIPDGATRADAVTHPLRGIVTNFADLCIRYGALTLYVPYKLHSAHVHPSKDGDKAYLTESGELADHPVRPSDDEHRVLLALCLLWATDGMNALLATGRLDVALQQATRILGTQLDRPRRR